MKICSVFMNKILRNIISGSEVVAELGILSNKMKSRKHELFQTANFTSLLSGVEDVYINE
jgi:hypothetical protein